MKLQFDDSVDVAEGRCANISIGGMLVSLVDPRPSGSLVRFELAIEEGLSIRGLGEVIWSRPKPAQGDAEIGVKYRFLEQRDRQLILKLVSQHIKERLEKKHPGDDSASLMTVPEPVAEAPSPSGGIPAAIAEAAAAARQKQAQTASSLPAEDASFDLPEEPLAAPADITFAESGLADSRPEDVLASTPELRQEPLSDAGDLELHSGGGADFSDPPLRDFSETPLNNDVLLDPDDPLSADHPLSDEPLSPDPLPSDPLPSDSLDSDPQYEPAAGPYVARRRPSRRRDFPVLPVVAVLLVLAVAFAFLYREQIFGSSAPDMEANDSDVEAGNNASPRPDAPDDANSSGNTNSNTEPAENTTEDPTAAPTSLSVENSPPAGEPKTAPPPPPPPKRQPPFRLVEDITWDRLPGGLRITVQADGFIPADRFENFRLEGDTPREVIKLLGVRKRFSKKQIDISGAAVQRIRIGWHGGSEVHLVLDMRDQSSKVRRVKPDGSQLIILID